MAISKVFAGSTIQRPSTLSQTSQAPNGVPLVGSNTLMIVGEAETGAPGSSVGYKTFTAAQFANLVATYKSGPIVDVANAALNPAKAGQGISGAQQIIIWKTNASTQASLALSNATPATVLTVKDRNWGAPGNLINVTVVNGTSTTKQRNITVSGPAKTEALGQNAASVQMTIQYLGSGSACALAIAGASDAAKTLTTVATGDTSNNLSIALAGLSIKDLVNTINTFGGGAVYTAVLSNVQTGSIVAATDLDIVSALAIKSSAGSLYRLQHEILDLINTSTLISATLAATPVAAIIAPITANLSGGAKGASADSDFADGFNKSLGQTYNVLVPAVSQDATADIALGVTDASSDYTIDSILAAMSSHLILRGNVRNAKEAQGVGGYRSTTKAAVYTQAETLGDFLSQLTLEDVLVVDAVTGKLTWKQPHVQAAMIAGMRLGSDVGTPLTHKFLNCSGIGQAVNPTTGIAAGDFDPEVDYDEAITAGVTFAESFQGGSRIVVDNTTYGVDESFVFNRGSVVQASQYIAQQLRLVGDTLFIGTKISTGAASSLKTALKAKLGELLAAQILTGTDQYPLGYDDKNMLVTISGNAASVGVKVIPVQGLDFIFISIVLGDIQQSA